MSIHISLNHRTRYQYDRAVCLGPQVVRLRPAPHCRTEVLSYSLRVSPHEHFINWQQDPQSNYLARLVFPEPTRELVVEVDLVAKMAVFNPFDFFLEPAVEQFPFEYDSGLDHELGPFRLCLPRTPRFEEYSSGLRRQLLGGSDKGVRTIDLLVSLNQHVHRDVRYIIRLEPGVQAPEETLSKTTGSCRDSAWLLCQLLRHWGFAARFVSGYLIQLAPDVKPLDGPAGPPADFTDLHAWCEVYLPGAGWIGLDATSGLLAGEGHIPLATAPDPTSAAPITGLVDECECEFSHEMQVSRILESPRVTKPYTEEQWSRIVQAGHTVDAELRALDCRLSMGGEPTFVSVDDMDGPEWNTLALGATKQARGDELIKRLRQRFAPGGLLHYGQGKWYPGESLPRWSYACYWRKDGELLWENEALIGDQTRNYGHDVKHAEEFVYALAEKLGCGGKWVMPGFEDAWYYLWKERRLPTNVDPHQSRLKDPEERARLAHIFEQGLEKVVGYCLPLEPASAGRWRTGPWFLRAERCYLIPGDSPMGLRLPLDSLPWVASNDYPHVHEADPMEPQPVPLTLPRRQAFLTGAPDALRLRQLPVLGQPGAGGDGEGEGDRAGESPSDRAPAVGQAADWIVRTGLCVEPRNGRLHVFMPPTRKIESYLECVTAVESVAARLDCPVILEGYPPPYDARLNVFKVTPDPGVLEVNIHPSQRWDELVDRTEILYEEARQARLGTEKFMLDGRHTGTGGGNHLVLGGPTPGESPFLQRPDLLNSFVTYWQNHPSLSFLFSGLFIGPTSQSPRVDEARNDSLYELEIASRLIPKHGSVPPWLVDRLFRNLLIDATGNTHRAEFCIDKLYSPDGSSGRLGLLEMRAFEMPPHARMSLAQQLLVRALTAKFWKAPYRNELVRWGTDLHDRWMLPHFVWSDFEDVIQDLQTSGFPVDSDWFKPHFEFKFPMCGSVEVRNMVLELRNALEPWHVMGEEGGPGGTVRYVDSSVERLQARVWGLTDQRHMVTVNGRALPLHPTGTHGEYVAGVRYRAWQPSSCLHPTIPVHAPLVFDLIDTWNRRSVGGCTYHVAHPGGRSYSTFPVNAFEAESRRLARFQPFGHTPGSMPLPAVERTRDFPVTLDLRRA